MNAQSQWLERNRAYLANAIEQLAQALEQHPCEDSRDKLMRLAGEHHAAEWSPAFDVLSRTFDLSSFEKLLLLLCAGFELDPKVAAACARIGHNGQHVTPSFALALAVSPDPHWSALSPASPLRHWRLIDVTTTSSLVNATLRIDERILHFLTGVSYLDDRLQSYVSVIESQPDLAFAYADELSHLSQFYQEGINRIQGLRVEIHGEDAQTQIALIATAMTALDITAYRLRAVDVPTTVVERDSLVRLWEREASLSPVVLVLDLFEHSDEEPSSGVRQLLDRLRVPVIVNASTSRRHLVAAHLSLNVASLSTTEQIRLWRRQLNDNERKFNGDLSQIVSQFDLTHSQIRSCAHAFNSYRTVIDRDAVPLLGEICRQHIRGDFQSLAQRIMPCATWDDLVLTDDLIELLHDIAAHVRHRYLVHETWGFSRRSQRGLGISALFSGPSGTGKTMAAEVLANELQLDLYRIDLSQVVNKYIGQTEKNLRRVFDCAESLAAILLFDEADALFGKRSEVRDSHDRHANIEVSYLLQRMETYRGLAILTTNRKDDLDQGFLRRIRFSLQFPFPDVEQRKGIWQRIFPEQTPVDELDTDRLSRLNIAGGNIRNIAIHAAFYGADEERIVDMQHVLRAVRREYAKLEKPLNDPTYHGRQ